jgi:hypothetical protein
MGLRPCEAHVLFTSLLRPHFQPGTPFGFAHGRELIHGLARADNTAIYPDALGRTRSW